MNYKNAACVEDMIGIARRRVPAFAFDYLDGGAGDDAGVKRNRAAFNDAVLKMVPLAGVGMPETEVNLFGRAWSMPIGVSPMGMANGVWPQTDLALARMAQRHNIPYSLSSTASTDIETIAKAAPDSAWFQLYVPEKEEMRQDLLKRARDCGVKVLGITVDVPVGARRNRNIRNMNGNHVKRMSPTFIMDVLSHPSWAWATLNAGTPNIEVFKKYSDRMASRTAGTMADWVQKQLRGVLNYDDIRRMRDQWKGTLLIKGVVDPHAAKQLVDVGVDGIWVSNHGGRQFESAVATLHALPAIRAAVGPNVPLIFDGGVRTGEDVIKALALGANMVFSARCFAYGTGAGGADGAERVFGILDDQIKRGLVQMGCPSIKALNPDWVISSKTI
jgi:L-lactate dehydrogenase (cytochrome)